MDPPSFEFGNGFLLELEEYLRGHNDYFQISQK